MNSILRHDYPQFGEILELLRPLLEEAYSSLIVGAASNPSFHGWRIEGVVWERSISPSWERLTVDGLGESAFAGSFGMGGGEASITVKVSGFVGGGNGPVAEAKAEVILSPFLTRFVGMEGRPDLGLVRATIDREGFLLAASGQGSFPVAHSGGSSPCRGCKDYVGQYYGGNYFCCAMHPFGPDSDHCPDARKPQLKTPEDEVFALRFAREIEVRPAIYFW